MKFKHVVVLASALSFSLPAALATAQQPQPKKGKTVKFTLKNPTGHAVNLKSGDDAITLQPGQSREMKVPAGTRITAAASPTDTTQNDTVVTEVSDGMSGTTVNIR